MLSRHNQESALTGIQLDDVWPLERDPRNPILPAPRLAEIRAMGGIPRIRMYDNTSTAILTRYEEVRELVSSPDVSSDGGKPGFPFMSEASRANRGGPQSIDRLDPPEHDEQRAMLAGYFTVKKIRALRPFIEETVDRLLDQLSDGKRSGDFVAEFAEPIPALAIAKVLALPVDDIPFFLDRVKTWMSEKSDPVDIKRAMVDITDYFERVIEERAGGTGEDVLSKLIREQVNTGNLSKDQFLLTMQLLIKAGFDTSANMIALGTVVLLQHRDQWEELVNDKDGRLVASAVEELLRSPFTRSRQTTSPSSGFLNRTTGVTPPGGVLPLAFSGRQRPS